MDEEVKEMEQEIDKLIKINTKLQQQTESMQSQSQKQSDLVKQVEAKHTEAIHKTEEEMKRLKFQFDAVTVNHRRLKAKENEYNEKIVSLSEANAVLQENTVKLQTKSAEDTKRLMEIIETKQREYNEMAELRQSLYDEKTVELAQKDRIIQDMKHEQQTKEEKRNKALESKEEEMKRVRGIVNDMKKLCTETITKLRDEKKKKKKKK
eukprot:192105_1